MSHIDPIHLERLPRDQISELAEIAIAEGNSRSIVGLGPIWDLIRGVEVLSWGLNRGLDIFAAQPWWLVFPALAVFGAILASYADQLGWRLARLEDAEDFGVPLSDGEQKLVRSKRSLCPPCGRRIAFYDNIPIVSWLTLRGRCRCGATAIPRRHLVSEVLGALLLPALFLSFGATTAFLAVVVYATLAGAGSLADLERRILPNRLNYSILWIGLAFAAVSPASRGHDALAHWLRAPLEVPIIPAVMTVLGGWIFLWLFNRILRGVYKQEDSLGWGDVKLLVALGAWLGPSGLVVAIVLGGCSACIYGLAARQREFPAGPHLALGGLLAMTPQVQEQLTVLVIQISEQRLQGGAGVISYFPFF